MVINQATLQSRFTGYQSTTFRNRRVNREDSSSEPVWISVRLLLGGRTAIPWQTSVKVMQDK